MGSYRRDRSVLQAEMPATSLWVVLAAGCVGGLWFVLIRENGWYVPLAVVAALAVLVFIRRQWSQARVRRRIRRALAADVERRRLQRIFDIYAERELANAAELRRGPVNGWRRGNVAVLEEGLGRRRWRASDLNQGG